ncbi:uncharacterized protein I303_105062 [Kwoniella dejecticola CBS 10117]|uniref:Uncharacterized protein n=1 Tax=Kwoniella dejecticola CBS 10117 TaxID=1296121 RepID=A0A1A6A3K0_9TREE|nr:uncharacterized protein I303_05492 [Kwoniella dejecticola CBS 10117]OBR84633.1 hypothetical protein I303_05492 [Kwoniella dejecticola CBS 10117]
MTTSITDARYNVIHHTPAYTSSLLFDDPPETGWSVMPGFDESLDIPPEYEPPRFDHDETLPNQLHPSYPYGRPASLNNRQKIRSKGVGNLLGTIGPSATTLANPRMGMGMNLRGGEWSSRSQEWQEWGMEGLEDQRGRREVPPGMAGAKRPPSPPSPALHPSNIPPPRSLHLRRLIERQQSSPAIPNEGFDAPVPNETYDEPSSPNGNGNGNGNANGNPNSNARQQMEEPVQIGQIGGSLGQLRRGHPASGDSERENEDESEEEEGGVVDEEED